MNKIKLFFTFVLTSLVLTSCESDKKEAKITLDPSFNSVNVDYLGGKKSVKFSVNADWELQKGNEDWCSLTPMKGSEGDITVFVNVGVNMTAEAREATVKIKAGNKEESFKISQGALASTDEFTLSETEKSVNSDEGFFNVVVFSENEWTTSGVPNWVTLAPDAGSAIATVKVSYQANPNAGERVADIEFKSGEEIVTLKLTQDGKGAGGAVSLSITKRNSPLGYDAFEVEVTSTLRWDIVDLPIWIYTDIIAGVGTKKVKVSVDANNKNQIREGAVTFRTDEGDTVLTIKQAANPEEHDDRAALIKLFESTNGSEWYVSNNWGSNLPLRQWVGVYTNNDGRVIAMELYNNNITGSLPAEIGNLKYITSLKISDNAIGGTIPKEIGNLKNLEVLSLSYNKITGNIPPEIFDLPKVKTFHLHNNELTGTIPTDIGKLTNVEYLYLWGNQLEGGIPKEVGNLTKVKYITMQNNKLTGTFPSELGNLVNAVYFVFANNQLSGDIPESFKNLKNVNTLYLQNNQFTGTIDFVGSMNMFALNLSGNKFSGNIPVSLAKPGIWYVFLQDNQLTGSIPAEFGGCGYLRYLNVANNNITGTLPPELANCGKMGDDSSYSEYSAPFDCSGNKMTGSVPSEYKKNEFYTLWKFNPQQEGYGITQ